MSEPLAIVSEPLAIDVMVATEPVGAGTRAAELAALGVDGLFSFENAHDVFFPLVLAAATPEAAGMDLMTNVAIAFPRSPMHLAHAAYDLQVLSKGRFRLGLGTQIRPHIERRYGSAWSSPLSRMRETVQAVHAIFDAWEGRAPLDFRGEFTTHTMMPPTFDPGPNPFGPPPVLVGALGPKMTEMAAEVADGILVMPFNSARHLEERTAPAIERGLMAGGRGLMAEGRAGRAHGAGRSSRAFEVICEAIVAMGDGQEQQAEAIAGARGLLAFYGSTPAYRPVLEVEGWADLQPQLQSMTREGRWGEMGALVSDEMVRTLAVAGTPEECAVEIRRRFGGMASRVCCYFPGYPVTDDAIRRLVMGMHAQ